jgi:DNA-directed RNA polymerase subunit RPC12/RpoP
MDQSARNMATCSRMIVQTGNQFAGWMTRWDEAAGKPRARFDRVPTQALTGRLRMVRSGATLFHDVAEGDDGEFTRIAEHPFGAEDLQDVRIAAATGGPDASLDVRVFDMRIRADSLTNTPAAETAVAPAKASLPWALIAGLSVTIGVILCLWGSLLMARRRSKTPASAKEMSLTEGISFMCSACGKKLKSKAEFAGKQLKCPQCGAVVLVPQRALDQASA